MSDIKQQKIIRYARSVLLAKDSTQSATGFSVTGLQSPASDCSPYSSIGMVLDSSSNSESCVSGSSITNVNNADGIIFIETSFGGVVAVRTDLHWQIYYVNKRRVMDLLYTVPSAHKAESVRKMLLRVLKSIEL